MGGSRIPVHDGITRISFNLATGRKKEHMIKDTVVAAQRDEINELREKYSITLNQIATASGLHKSYICRYLKGHHDNVTVKTIRRLDDAIDFLVASKVQWCKDIVADDIARRHTHQRFDGTVSSQSLAEASAES